MKNPAEPNNPDTPRADPYADDQTLGDDCLSLTGPPIDPIERLREAVNQLESLIEYQFGGGEKLPLSWMDQHALHVIEVTRRSLEARPGTLAIEVARQIELVEHLLTWPGYVAPTGDGRRETFQVAHHMLMADITVSQLASVISITASDLRSFLEGRRRFSPAVIEEINRALQVVYRYSRTSGQTR